MACPFIHDNQGSPQLLVFLLLEAISSLPSLFSLPCQLWIESSFSAFASNITGTCYTHQTLLPLYVSLIASKLFLPVPISFKTFYTCKYFVHSIVDVSRHKHFSAHQVSISPVRKVSNINFLMNG